MRRIAFIAASILAAATAFASTATGDNEHTYFIELDNAFGLVTGSEVKVAGVEQGLIESLEINSDKRAVIEVKLSGELSQLGTDTICSSEPQSLIAEYFIDCIPKGPPLQEGTGSDAERGDNPDIPVEQTRQTVQNDLVQSGLRDSYKERLTLIINEFGTALAGNPENLNDAIRRGAPALEEARKITRVLADQNRIIRDLNENSDTVLAQLANRRKDVVRFIENSKTTAEASAEVRDSLSANFRDLDEFLAELNPTAKRLNELAVTQTPLLRDLRLAGPGLADLSRDLPDFNAAGTVSLKSLGSAANVGQRALRKGRNEIQQLKVSSKNAFSAADSLSKFLRDLDDPNRAVAQDKRANVDTGRKGKTGYTGLEGLLNYVYYQAGALNQFDQVSHLLHFSIFEVGEGPCASYNAGNTVPAEGGGETTNILEADNCVSWLGPNQPGINENIPLEPYDPSVCPDGSTDEDICDPNGASLASDKKPVKRNGGNGGGEGKGSGGNGSSGSGNGGGSGGNSGGGNGSAGGSGSGAGNVPGGLGDALDLPKLGNSIRNSPLLQRGGNSGLGGGGSNPTRDLLGYLFSD